tara:strand:- start:404 stop:550 length:147 start_codon:yes stop_codon:yes gene_type:complete
LFAAVIAEAIAEVFAEIFAEVFAEVMGEMNTPISPNRNSGVTSRWFII